MTDAISERVRRFVLTSIPSVPHLETLLLLWREPVHAWSVEEIASRLYVTPAVARAIADELLQADLLQAGDAPGEFRSRREPPALAALLDELDATYLRQLRAVTVLIHSNTQRKAARFADAFSWRKQ